MRGVATGDVEVTGDVEAMGGGVEVMGTVFRVVRRGSGRGMQILRLLRAGV
jgi:hypothetical protein